MFHITEHMKMNSAKMFNILQHSLVVWEVDVSSKLIIS